MSRAATPDRAICGPVPAYLLRTVAVRRLRRGKAVAALVSLSLALAIAAAFTVTAMTRVMVWNIQARIREPGKGTAMIRAAAKRAFLPWHAVSLAAVVVASAAISCVLAVAFVGRKKSLGVLKILGGTARDLARLLYAEALYMGVLGIPIGMAAGMAIVANRLGLPAITPWCFVVSAASGATTLGFGVWIPMRLVRNASCDQLLHNRPVYAFSNPSCAKCGLCGGF